jgi:hypothetical protein
MILFARSQGHARRQAQGSIGVPACVPDTRQGRRLKAQSQILPAEPFANLLAVTPGKQAGRLCTPLLIEGHFCQDLQSFIESSRRLGKAQKLYVFNAILRCLRLTLEKLNCFGDVIV